MALWNSLHPIDRTQHEFTGFSPEDGIDAMFARRLRVSDALPSVEAHRDVLFTPPRRNAPDPWATGGLQTADGTPIPLVRDWFDGERVMLGLTAPEPAEPGAVIAGDVLYLGWLFDNFGHLLLESLARVWALDLVREDMPVLFHYWPDIVPPAFAFGVLERFGIARSRIIIPDRPTRFRSLLIPDPMFLITSVVHERACRVYRAVAGAVTGGGKPAGPPVHFSRSRLPSSMRQVVGETALEEVLRDNGFLIIHPETMPFADQVRVAASHPVITLCAGSAAQLLLFAQPGTRVHLFGSRALLEDKVLGCEMAGLRATYHHALRWRGSLFAAEQIDLAAAITGLAADGLLPDRSRIPFLPPDDELDAAFDEAWLIGALTRFPPDHAILRDHASRVLDRLPVTAWPVFAALAARMPADRLSDAQADTMMTLFTNALLEEPDAGKRYRHAAQVRALAEAAYPRCTPETQAIARAAIEARLPMSA